MQNQAMLRQMALLCSTMQKLGQQMQDGFGGRKGAKTTGFCDHEEGDKEEMEEGLNMSEWPENKLKKKCRVRSGMKSKMKSI